ncbi:phytoene desaturase family protein [Occallatibacter savannae]|uniref:phytoene desaturase family protein n=1 Tax=Occallatibacter savannae TaxID=1002691 RepID=UPI000D6935A8|nr:NAD(P)/FAD-dependent oxidoreductase [Occallatibacter savannae]
MRRARIIGSGPNGLSAAIALAQAGVAVEVFEAKNIAGGGARTLPLTLPGFMHDFGSAVHPMAAASPFFDTLPLAEHGLEWIHGDFPLAHPLDDGSAVLLHRELADQDRELGPDAKAWRGLIQDLVDNWDNFAQEALGPAIRIPRHPWLMARFGAAAFQPARRLATRHFRSPRTRALFAGLAAHSFLSLDDVLTSAIALVFAAVTPKAGWPIPRGGSQSITRALQGVFEGLGGKLYTGVRIDAAAFRAWNSPECLTLFDTSPRQLVDIAGECLTPGFRELMTRFKRGPGAFKIDYALSRPVPWRARECRRAITLHLGGTLEEIAESERLVGEGRCPDRPFVLAAQPSLFDATRAPEGKHTLWAYCHVPNGSTVDMTDRIEAQIERFAPGFRDCIMTRYVSTPAILERMDANLIGGDISGGAMTMKQFLLRPSALTYETSAANLFLCSSSTPPGGGVHGMCGYRAAKVALSRSGHR